MKLIVCAFTTASVLFCSFDTKAQVQESQILDNGIRIYPAQGVEVVKEKPVPTQKVITIDEMDLVQATEMLSVLKSKSEYSQGQDKANYQKQIALVEERIKKLNIQKN
ncbi:MAG: hypothetical protein LW688_08730 [Cryomorphaceae bacterium]|nr:hypothetical protein [Cryomorphaceae bacterium]